MSWYRKIRSGGKLFESAVIMALIYASSGQNVTSSPGGQDEDLTSKIEIILPVVILVTVLLVILVLVVLWKKNIIKTNPCRIFGERLSICQSDKSICQCCNIGDEDTNKADVGFPDTQIYMNAKNDNQPLYQDMDEQVDMFEDSFLGLRTSIRRRNHPRAYEENDPMHSDSFLGLQSTVKHNRVETERKYFATAKGGDNTIGNTNAALENYDTKVDDTRNMRGSSPFLPEYPWTGISPRGLAVIIGIDKFDKIGNLDAVIKDRDMVKTTFQSLDFDIAFCEFHNKRDIKAFLQNIAESEVPNYDCFVCYISSHGTDGNVCCRDANSKDGTGYLEIDYIIGLFLNDTCKRFNEKPKLFFLDICLGPRKDVVLAVPKGHVRQFNTSRDRAVAYEHIFIAYATLTGFVSWAESDGSRFTKSVIKSINKSGPVHAITDIWIAICGEMRKRNKTSEFRQTPKVANNLTSHLYLKKTLK